MPKPKPTVLLTRPMAQSNHFAQALREAGYDGEPVISPILRIEGMGVQLNLDGVGGVIFTSRHAIDFVPAAKMPAWCVGDRTCDVALAAGWDAVSAHGDADALVTIILEAAPAGELVHFRGEHSRGHIAERLTQAGIETVEHLIYRQTPLELTPEASALLAGETPVIVPLFSPRSACLFADNGPFRAPVRIVAMSEAVTQSLNNIDVDNIIVTPKPTAASMMESVLSLIDAA